MPPRQDLAEPAHDVRSERVGHAKRQAPPHRDQRAVLRVERVVRGNRSALEQVELVEQRRGLESPVLLECERSRVAFAAAVVEYPDATLACAPHELPVLE